MARQTHFDRVRELVSRHSGAPEAEITMETRLYEDLGMDGDDGAKVLAAFASEFAVDIGGVAPTNYFNDEAAFGGYSVLIPVAAWISPRFRARVLRSARGLRALSVRDLVASARAGRWITPQVARADAELTRLSLWGRVVLAGSVAFPALIGLWQYLYLGAPAGRAGGLALGVLALVWGALALRFLLALPWLRRLDAAAAHEERHLSEGD